MNNVVCHSGFTYAERPTAFWWEGELLEVSAVETEWRTPQGRGFRVRTPQGQRFELFYNEHNDEWEITPV
ncbi:MAG: hypothetical protein WHV66_08585 [Anaerolineales bacterium]|jgi:hypothetical protein